MVAFLARGLYRSRQFFRSVAASIDKEEADEVRRRLTPEQQCLFFAMTARDQRHCYDVFKTLSSQRGSDADLLAAALLHDVGKGRIRLWHRVAYVVLGAISPSLLRKAARDDGAAWRQACAACIDHSRRGGTMLEQVGAPAAIVQLVLYHERAKDCPDQRAVRLQAADESC